MRKSKAETAKTRERIVAVASESIRTQGIEATGVAEIMAAAGLTHGGFYRHFSSKEELVREAIALCRKDFVAGTLAAADEGAGAMLEHFQEYATPAHRDDLGSGCPLAANGSEIVRADVQTRHLATEGFRLIYEKAAPFMRPQDDESQIETAISVMTSCSMKKGLPSARRISLAMTPCTEGSSPTKARTRASISASPKGSSECSANHVACPHRCSKSGR